eukprot:TRINITY_DN19990_c0_g1_i1.p1 TRINITY_DN19990_c0_g1~~TRINITY_DN19990_c0_g1_i1.p1  ORF type:complete len:267 (+),score=107.08 TRINITY_DN19990_c0_g1_i1:68-868(+)
MDPKGVLLVAALLSLAVYTGETPLQTEAWVGYDRDAGIIVFMKVAAACCGFGLIVQTLWLTFVNKSLLSANNFVQLCLSLLFCYNWVWLIFNGSPTPLSIGFQSGACAGYELYSTISEVKMYITGEQKRVDMLLHHGLCILFTAATLYIYPRVATADLYYWHLVWDSISRTLVSNFALNLRYFVTSVPFATNAFFAWTFLWVRWVEQFTFTRILVNSPFDIKDHITWVVVAGWVGLTVLNLYWGIAVLKIGLGMKKPEKQKSTKSE